MPPVQSEETESQDIIEIEQAINTAFSPHAPINQASLFRGRKQQIRDVVDTVTSAGLHAVIYGDRGVGKTSLANMIADYLGDAGAVSKVICAQSDDFSSVVRRSLGTVQLSMRQARLGLHRPVEEVPVHLLEFLDTDPLIPDAVASLLSQLGLELIIVVDEFDRLANAETAAFADFLKALSDRGATTTAVLVGVAEDINQLLASHASVVRNLRQINLPRMSEDELEEIIDKGMAAGGFTFVSGDPKQRIISVSQGFPHYTHLLAQYAARTALDGGRRTITDDDVIVGMRLAVERADQSIRDLYHRATTGARKDHLWREVVGSCAIAETDERGYFSIREVQEALSRIADRPVSQQAVSYHLGKLIASDHGPILERTGPQRRYRYRFINSLMRPFILMKAIDEGLVQA